MESKKEKYPKRKRNPAQNPIEASVVSWLDKLRSTEGTSSRIASQEDRQNLITSSPRRWTVYPPLLLLPAGAFTSPAWQELLSCLEASQVDELWQSILSAVSQKTGGKQQHNQLTHLAVNEGIPLQADSTTSSTSTTTNPKSSKHESDHKPTAPTANPSSSSSSSSSPTPWNHLRTPSGLRMLHGDFGPAAAAAAEQQQQCPKPDFSSALWVSTTQNGIHQTWAPRWTMFSRGNIKEKARLLAFHSSPISSSAPCPAPSSSSPKTNNNNHHRSLSLLPPAAAQSSPSPHHHHHRRPSRPVAIDLYAGIGYFAFSYASLGFSVLCWELNPWSVEALRRGAEANGWGCKVFLPGDDDDDATDNTIPENFLEDFWDEEEEEEEGGGGGGGGGKGAQIVVFQEDNAKALGRIRRWGEEVVRVRERKGEGKGEEGEKRREKMMNVVHVNCGLLPTSWDCWGMAWDIAALGSDCGEGGSNEKKAWLHLHENVGVDDIEKRRGEIEEWFRGREERDEAAGNSVLVERTCEVDHVELVKTYAPGVWHCVFDLYIITTDKV